MIELSDFCKSYPGFCVKNVFIKAEDGLVTGLLGENGSGKSTVLKAAAKIHYADSGIIKNSSSGYVSENSELPENDFVIEYLESIADFHSIKGEEKKLAIKKVIKDFELEDVLLKKIGKLSKGFAKRVSFAAALVFNPKNLILDEIVSGLDPLQIIKIRKIIKSLSEEKAILLSTHILKEAEILCDKIYIINNGKITAKGTKDEIIKNSGTRNFEEAFMFFTQNQKNQSLKNE